MADLQVQFGWIPPSSSMYIFHLYTLQNLASITIFVGIFFLLNPSFTLLYLGFSNGPI